MARETPISNQQFPNSAILRFADDCKLKTEDFDVILCQLPLATANSSLFTTEFTKDSEKHGTVFSSTEDRKPATV